MGIFGGNFSKVGPGVSKNAPEKNRFFLFFELLGRKFTKLIPLNLMYFVTLIPLIGAVLLSIRINPQIMDNGEFFAENFGKMPIFVFTGDIVGLILLIISILITGPATCGFTYVLRNMQRQEHTWILSDFREQFGKNYKQGLVVGILSVLLPFMLYIAYAFYSYSMPAMMGSDSLIPFIGKYLIIIMSIIFIMMQYYIYVMVVTFDMKLRDILKNSVIFALAKLPINVFITIIIAAVVLVSVWYFPIGVLCALLISLSLLGFFIVFTVYPTIDKSMIKSQLPEESEEDEEARDFEDMV